MLKISLLLWWLVPDELRELTEMGVDVLHPLTLLLHDVVCSACILDPPFVDELANESKFCSCCRDAKSIQCPVILITSNSNSHGFFGSTLHGAHWERCFFGNLSEDLEHTWSSFFHVLGLSSVEGVDEGIAV